MTCPTCGGFVELPEPKMPAWCPGCDETFHPIEHHGFFSYDVTVYAPKDDDE